MKTTWQWPDPELSDGPCIHHNTYDDTKALQIGRDVKINHIQYVSHVANWCNSPPPPYFDIAYVYCYITLWTMNFVTVHNLFLLCVCVSQEWCLYYVSLSLQNLMRPIRDLNPWPSDCFEIWYPLKVWCSTGWANRARVLLGNTVQNVWNFIPIFHKRFELD